MQLYSRLRTLSGVDGIRAGIRLIVHTCCRDPLLATKPSYSKPTVSTTTVHSALRGRRFPAETQAMDYHAFKLIFSLPNPGLVG